MSIPLSSFRSAMETSIHEEEIKIGVESRILHLSLEGGRAQGSGVEEDDGVAGKVHGLRYELSSIHPGVGNVVEVAAE